MEHQTNRSEPAPSKHGSMGKKDVYAIITSRITAQLSQGLIPWRKPWTDAGIPRNVISKRPYRGINLMLLSMLGYEHNLFLTFNQLKELGGYVKRGEHAHQVVFWNMLEIGVPDGSDGDQVEHHRQRIPMLRYYHVFNISQCEGIPAHCIPVREVHSFKPIETAERIANEMPQRPQIMHREQQAYYNPMTDVVNMPKQDTFSHSEAYYSTLFHELVHATGHPTRLARSGLVAMSEFSRQELYSHEELVAEIGSCYLQSFAGITNELEQSAAYIQGWLRVLENDSRFIFSAAMQAQKATDFILNLPSEVLIEQKPKPDNSVGLYFNTSFTIRFGIAYSVRAIDAKS